MAAMKTGSRGPAGKWSRGDEQQCSRRQVGEIITRELNDELEVVSIRDTSARRRERLRSAAASTIA
jgi:hypothetical protein